MDTGGIPLRAPLQISPQTSSEGLPDAENRDASGQQPVLEVTQDSRAGPVPEAGDTGGEPQGPVLQKWDLPFLPWPPAPHSRALPGKGLIFLGRRH